MVTNEQVKDMVEASLKKASSFYQELPKLRLFKNVDIEFTTRTTRTIGTCRHNREDDTFTLKFSKNHMECNEAELFQDIVDHEVSHMVDYLVYNGWGHSASFKRVMREVFNKDGSATEHRITSPDKSKKRKRTRHVYLNPRTNKEFYVTGKRHTRKIKECRRFFDPATNEDLIYTGKTIDLNKL